jgi:RNA polymerase sigma factor for flagellar operon FliA
MDEAGRKKLLEEYAKLKSPELREKIILEYAPLVKVVAGRLSMWNMMIWSVTGFSV